MTQPSHCQSITFKYFCASVQLCEIEILLAGAFYFEKPDFYSGSCLNSNMTNFSGHQNYEPITRRGLYVRKNYGPCAFFMILPLQSQKKFCKGKYQGQYISY